MNHLKKTLFIFLSSIFIFVSCDKGNLQGTVQVIDKGDIKIHTYTCPENGGVDSTHIIETKNKIVLIDAQFVRPFAKEFRKYANSLKKPVDRIIISHSHPDHWFGLEFFKDVPIYSLKGTQQEIIKYGDFMIKEKKAQMGELVPSKKVVPNKIINEGKETIDGLEYIFSKVMNGEAHTQLLIKIPSINTLVAQDLVFNNVHLFTGQKAFDGWISVLNELKKMNGYSIILAGHGPVAESNIYDRNIQYIMDAKDAYNSSKNGKELKDKLMAKYSSLKAPYLIDISSKFLYKK